jgi:hypothetical protein
MHQATEVGRFSARLCNKIYASAYVSPWTTEVRIWLLLLIDHVVAFPQELTFRAAFYIDIKDKETRKIITAYLNHIEIFPILISIIFVKLHSFKFL